MNKRFYCRYNYMQQKNYFCFLLYKINRDFYNALNGNTWNKKRLDL